MTPVAGFQVGLGELMAVSGAICLSIATIVAKKHLTHVPLGIHNTVRTGLGTIVYFGLVLWMYGFDHFMGVLSPFLWQWMLLYGTTIVVIGQSLWNAGFRNSSIATASLIGSFAPIVGILAAYLILDEVPTRAQYIGGMIILLGLFLSQVGIRARTDRLKSTALSSIMKYSLSPLPAPRSSLSKLTYFILLESAVSELTRWKLNRRSKGKWDLKESKSRIE
jgi:drug/metabolite transporter (DMT)-like permease